MIPASSLAMIAQDPRPYLKQCYQLEARVKMKNKRIAHLYRVSTQITSAAKAVSSYTGPNDKIGNCVLEIVTLQEEISEDVDAMLAAQKEISQAIKSLVQDVAQRSILEARYLAGLSWEEIAYSFHYAYRHVLRLHSRGLAAMKESAAEALQTLENKEETT